MASELQYSRNDVKMPWGDFLVNLTTRVDFTFSPRMTIRSLTQSGDTDKLRQMSVGILQTFTAKEWALVAEAPSALASRAWPVSCSFRLSPTPE